MRKKIEQGLEEINSTGGNGKSLAQKSTGTKGYGQEKDRTNEE